MDLPLSKEKHLQIHQDFPATLLIIQANKDEMITLFSNLLHKAIKYTQDGSISVSAQEDAQQNTIHIQVADTGDGIHQEDLSKLFTSFSTLSYANKQNNSSGFGLSICKQIHSTSLKKESK
jgi:signal transduction histidine kinase